MGGLADPATPARRLHPGKQVANDENGVDEIGESGAAVPGIGKV
jgi:hypothetical protein